MKQWACDVALMLCALLKVVFEGCGVRRGVPHKRLAQCESVDGGVDVVVVWV